VIWGEHPKSRSAYKFLTNHDGGIEGKTLIKHREKWALIAHLD
jgi:hypothetical protein